EPAECLRALLHPGSERLRIADIGDAAMRLHALAAQSLDGRADLVLVARADRNVGPFGSERFGDGAPDPPGCATHHRAQSPKLQIHVRLPFPFTAPRAPGISCRWPHPPCTSGRPRCPGAPARTG